jgi:hypothetical protein
MNANQSEDFKFQISNFKFKILFLMPRTRIADLLSGGDRRSLGRADGVAAMVMDNPRLFPELLAGLWSDDRLVRMRAADAAEKVTRKNPELLRSRKKEMPGLMAEAGEPELRWHLALMVSRLTLNAAERQVAISLLIGYLEDRSSIVRTFVLQGLAELAFKYDDDDLRSQVIEILRQAIRGGTPAMKARSRKLLRQLEP